MTTQSEELFNESKKYVPGGVHSPVRSFKNLHTTPKFMTKGKGAYITDIDNNEYIDFCMSFGPLILGHRDSDVEKKLIAALQNGWSFGACEPYSLELAKKILERLPFVDQIRFVNSGTEAVMTALRLARGVTGKDKILKFDGCYHGHTDSMLIKAGSGLAGEAESSSKGVPQGIADDTIVVSLNNYDDVRAAFDKYKGQIGTVIIEPLPANNGLLKQDLDFLKFIREICTENGALLIFDEVISGFRVAFGGMAEATGITPDIVTYGKIIGGGLPVGAIAAKKEIMENLAPLGGVYQAGTLSANPLAMIGGMATLSKLNKEAYQILEANTQKIVKLFNKWFAESKEFKNYKAISEASLFWLVPTDQDIKSIDRIPESLSEQFYKLFEVMLAKGIYLSPNAYEIAFVSLAHDDKVIKDLKDRLWS